MNEEANLISKFPAAFHGVDAMGFPKGRKLSPWLPARFDIARAICN